MAITIRPLIPLDRATVGQLRQSVGWAVRDDDPLLMLLDQSGELSTLVAMADEEERVAGIVQATNYASVSSIGNMIVHPDFQRQGIAQRLMETVLRALDSQGVTTTFLEATAAGRPVYERVGLLPYHTTTVWLGSLDVLTNPDSVSLSTAGALEAVVLDHLTTATMREVIACDAAAFGSPRPALLNCCWQSAPDSCFLLRSATGACHGYIMARPGTIGPLVAQTVDDARLLLGTLAQHSSAGPDWLSRPMTMSVPDHNNALQAWLQSCGWTQRPNSCTHMRRGPDPMPDWQRYQALAGLGVG